MWLCRQRWMCLLRSPHRQTTPWWAGRRWSARPTWVPPQLKLRKAWLWRLLKQWWRLSRCTSSGHIACGAAAAVVSLAFAHHCSTCHHGLCSSLQYMSSSVPGIRQYAPAPSGWSGVVLCRSPLTPQLWLRHVHRPFVKQSPAPHGWWLPYKVQSHRVPTEAAAAAPPPTAICTHAHKMYPARMQFPCHKCLVDQRQQAGCSLPSCDLIPQPALRQQHGAAGRACAHRSQRPHGASRSAEGAPALCHPGSRPGANSCAGVSHASCSCLAPHWLLARVLSAPLELPPLCTYLIPRRCMLARGHCGIIAAQSVKQADDSVPDRYAGGRQQGAVLATPGPPCIAASISRLHDSRNFHDR